DENPIRTHPRGDRRRDGSERHAWDLERGAGWFSGYPRTIRYQSPRRNPRPISRAKREDRAILRGDANPDESPADTDELVVSRRSRRQHKAWGASPRKACLIIRARAREAGDSIKP